MSAKLLLVEDNPLNADMLSRRLIKRGYSVCLAGDGLRAVECAQADPPNLILMDISLPEIDGLEATRRVKACPATARIPVIALTAHAMVSDRVTSLAAGCDEFETKPIDLARLVEKIERLLAAAVTTE
jgi:two-component system cell cycle response regulator DivK